MSAMSRNAPKNPLSAAAVEEGVEPHEDDPLTMSALSKAEKGGLASSGPSSSSSSSFAPQPLPAAAASAISSSGKGRGANGSRSTKHLHAHVSLQVGL